MFLAKCVKYYKTKSRQNELIILYIDIKNVPTQIPTMPYLEYSSHQRAFDYFRHQNHMDVDWVKLQVYGKHCVPEEFPKNVTGFTTILEGA